MLKWVFGADISPFKKSLGQMREQTQALAGSLKGQLASALGIGVIIGFFKNLFQEMDRVQKLGLRFGETAEVIQKIGHAASLAGSDLEGIAKGLTVVTKNAYEAATGNEKFAEAFAALGIKAEEFVNLPMDEKVLTLARAMEGAQGDGEKLALAMQILGKSGADLVPLLAGGSEAIKKLFDETQTVSQDTVDSIARFNDTMESWGQKLQVFAGNAVGGIKMIWAVFTGSVEAGAGVLQGLVNGVMKTLIAPIEGVQAAMDGGMGGLKKWWGEYKEAQQTNIEDATRNVKRSLSEMAEEVNKSLTPGSRPGGGATVVDPEAEAKAAEEAAKSAEKVADKKKDLAKDIAQWEEEQARKKLSAEDQIDSLIGKRLELLEKAAGLEGEDQVEAYREAFDLEKEMAKVAEDAAKDKAKAEEDLANKKKSLAQEIADLEEKSAMSKMTTEEKILALQAKRAGLVGSLDGKTGVEAMEIKKKILETDQEIDPLKGGLEDKRQSDLKKAREDLDKVGKESPTLIASSLAEVGGGGPAAVFGEADIERRKVDLLTQIKDLLASGQGSPSQPLEPS